jgi:c-di-GMP-binding flagellar brake protein YcgR
MGKLVEVEIPVYRELQVVTRDISGGGLRAMVGERFEPGMQLTVILLIENERIEVKAEVVRCQIFDETVKRYDCGLRFLEVEEKIRSRIIAFIFEKQRNLRKKGLV